MPRPIILGVVGDSAAGKTTITRGLVRLLGDEHVTHIAADDYHRYDRRQRAERGITPLHPDCNHLDIMEQDLAHVRGGRAILKPVYQHKDGTFGPAVYVAPRQFTVVEGLLGYQAVGAADDIERYASPHVRHARFVDIDARPGRERALQGAGSVHHIAFAVVDRAAQMQVRERLVAAGHQVTPQIDRNYFYSIYFRSQGGVLFEIATEEPGFMVDEPRAELGRHLKLPRQHEHLRAELERVLPPLSLPG